MQSANSMEHLTEEYATNKFSREKNMLLFADDFAFIIILARESNFGVQDLFETWYSKKARIEKIIILRCHDFLNLI